MTTATGTILIAERTGTLSSELRSFAEENGFQISITDSLKGILLKLQEQMVDVLILDSALFEGDCDFISIVKGMREGLPIIICAEVNTPEFESKVRKRGIFYYHIKSFGTRELETAVSSAVKR